MRSAEIMAYPDDGQTVPEIALEYPGEAGRHSGTYPVPGLRRGEPALKLTIRDAGELDEVIDYIRAMLSSSALPHVRGRIETKPQQLVCGYEEGDTSISASHIDPASMPIAEPVKPRREAIPRLIQREVWQRDGGRCVECFARERLCFDHIVPFSKGGGNSVRNLQLLCEPCNLSKSNRI
jgi:hypothetical protein